MRLLGRNRLIQAIIFDMDGVLVDSELHWKTTEASFLKSIAPSWNDEWQSKIIGMSLPQVHSILIESHGVSLSREELISFYEPIAQDIYQRRAKLLEGAAECLTLLAARPSLKVGLCSSSPRNWIELVLERFSLVKMFHAVISSDDVKGKGKPAPDIYQLAARTLGTEVGECLAVEDSRNGVLSAKAAEMICVGFRNGFNLQQDLSVSDMEIEGFSALVEFLNRELS